MAEETHLDIQTIGPTTDTIIEPPPPILVAPTAHNQPDARKIQQEDEDAASCTSSSDTEDEFEQCDCTTETTVAEIPYKSVYETEKQVKERGYFIQTPSAAITHAERDTRSVHLVDRYIYTIEVKHGRHQWLVLRRFSDFRDLNGKLLLFRAGENIAAPMHRLAERRQERRSQRRLKAQTLKYGHGGTRTEAAALPAESGAHEEPNSEKPNTIHVEKTVRLPPPDSKQPGKEARKHNHAPRPCKLPRFPLLPDTAVSQEKLEQRKEELGRFLSAVLHVPAYRNHSETLEFLGVSRLSFVSELGLKGEEGFIKKCPGGETHSGSVKRLLVTKVAPWRKRWLVLKDSYLVYLRPKHQEISEVLLFENGFNVDTVATKGSGGSKNTINISNQHRTLRIKCRHDWVAEEWRRALTSAVQTIGAPWLEPNRFGSSYPIRESTYARWFVDGRSFMEEAANMIEMAREDVFITDWWLSPEVFLKRPPSDPNVSAWRLDTLLKKKAEQGVKIFVLLYKEVTMALSINSLYTKMKLQSLHPNVRVMRHRGELTWAHHEKLIVVDQAIAFVGGIDLCYGRWDDHRHRLVDIAGAPVEESIHLQGDLQLAGKLLSGLVTYGDEKEEEKHRQEGAAPRRESVGRLRRFTLKKRDSLSLAVTNDKREPSPEFDGSKGRRMSKGLDYLAEWRARAKRNRELKELKDSDDESEEDAALPAETVVEITGNEKWWVGKDYVNFIFKDFQITDPFVDFIDRTRMPRMPWHDIASVVYGKAARDVARHFIERWNTCKVEKCHDDPRYPFLLPKSYENVEVPKRLRRKAIGCSIQIIRSACDQTTGRNQVENSIYQAYIESIEKAEHYVYIENQFFVSQVGTGKTVLNGIAQALFDRIVKAHKNNESFRVYVVMPLLPGFEVSTALFTVLHWTYLSISKGQNCLLRNLEIAVGDPSKYITFCSLRKHDKMADRLVTELIYIHSKLLIVDDRIVIIGSANINDRSQLGSRDSEVAIYAEDTEFEPSKMSGQPYQSGKFAGSLRRQLFREHLGLLDECPATGPDEHKTTLRRDKIDITDPASEEFFSLWKGIAEKNTALFEEIFDCLPNNNIRSQKQLAEYQPGNECVTDRRHALERIKGIQGFLVALPLHFLIDSDLTPPITTKEGWAPSKIFI